MMQKGHEEIGNRLLTAKEIAQRLNISKAFAYKLMQIGEIRTVKIGGSVRVRPEDLEAYIEENLQETRSMYRVK